MSITKAAAPGVINQGQNSVFTLVVTNNGPSVAEGVFVSDFIPAGLDYVSNDSGCGFELGLLSCSLGDFQPGQTQTIKVTVTGVDVGIWLNEADVTSDTEDPNPNNNKGSDDVEVGPTADLRITKSGAQSVKPGEQFTYSMEVENKGPSEATGVVIDDPLPQGLQFVSSPDCTPAMVCQIGTLQPNQTVTVSAVVQATTAVAGTTVTNTATVTGDQFDPTPDDNVDSVQTFVTPQADLAVTKTGPATIAADSRIRWQITVTNSGPNPAQNVALTDNLPPEVTNPMVTTSQGVCDRTIACSLGAIPVNGSVQLTVEADVPRNTPVDTVLTNNVRVATSTDEPNTSNNAARWDTTVLPPAPFPPDVGIRKERNDGEVMVGDVVVFRLVATNFGEATARNIVIEDRLSPKLRFISASIPGGTCQERNATVTCRRSTLDGLSSVTAKVKVRTIATGNVVNTATIDSSNATISVPSWTIRFPVRAGSTDIGVTKQADRRRVPAGDTVGYRIAVSNLTDQAAVNVTACDRLPGGTTVVNAGGGRLEGGRICWDIPFFAGGAAREYRIVLRVDRFFNLDTLRNVATAVAGNVRGVRRAKARVDVISIGNSARGGGVTG
jgi:uncharacterized repeat protein (TIGR01451 family)